MYKYKLFEIPVYSMSEEEYEIRVKKLIKRALKRMKRSENSDLDIYYRKKYNNRPWLYNEIIGYIVISYKSQCIWFDYLEIDNKKMCVNREKRTYIKDRRIPGYHFGNLDSFDDNALKSEINKYVNAIKKEYADSPKYVDKKLFELQLKNIDIRKMINEVMYK